MGMVNAMAGEQKTCRWQCNPQFMIREVMGEALLVPVDGAVDARFENCMISLNETSAFLWKLFMAGPKSEEEAVELARMEYSAPEGVIEDHIHRFVAAYAECGLLVKEEK